MTAGKHLEKNALDGFGCYCFDMAQNWVIPEGELPIGSGYPVNDTPSEMNFKTESKRGRGRVRRTPLPHAALKVCPNVFQFSNFNA